MIKSYLVVALRNLLRNRNYTLLNVAGLSIGVTACVIIYLLISYDLSFDKFNSKYDNIYRVVHESYSASGTEYNSAAPYPLIPAFRNDFPDMPLITGIHYEDDVVMKVGAEKHRITNVIFADSLFFDVFDFKVLSGNPRIELGEPGKVFLTKSLADKIMQGREHVTIKLDNMLELEVAGIVADPLPTSTINFSMIVSYPSLNKQFINGMDMNEWGMTVSGYAYFVKPDNLSSAAVESRLDSFLKKYEAEQVGKRKYLLQALSDMHFSKRYTGNPGNVPNGVMASLVALGIVGAFILLMACINFVNLATALAVKKSKEIGIRKTLGARRGELTSFFLGETFIIIALALFISLGATEWLLIWINNFTEKHLELNLLGDPALLLFLFALLIFATLLSGFYPAAVLSGYNPVAVLKNKMSVQGSSGAGVRKALVVFQFTIAQILIIGTMIVANQMDYFMSKPLGFKTDAIVNISIPDNKKESLESMRTKVEALPGIERLSFSLGGPTSDNHFGTGAFLTSDGKDTEFDINMKPVDRFYIEVYGLRLKAGHWFTEAEERAPKDMDKKTGFVYIVNEAFVRKLGLTKPEQIIGKTITTGLSDISAEVIGVVEDFHEQSLHEEIAPIVMVNFPFFYYDAGVKVNSEAFRETIGGIEKAYQEVYPEFEFRYEFLDEYLAKLYREDNQTFTLFKVFAGVSILISCLGLYGLISFMANQKMKEVGIRKVLGASVESIVVLFGREFLKLIVIAFAIATPVTWYFMKDWLDGFAYRTPMRWTDFVIGVSATLFIALLTVGYRSIRSAVANPVDALRSE
ncbi:MAG TPA: FtsX-like permease family protein [Chryseolinea sp.]|nr:FtsX-like permease family protein [Chryseolinea sp.]